MKTTGIALHFMCVHISLSSSFFLVCPLHYPSPLLVAPSTPLFLSFL